MERRDYKKAGGYAAGAHDEAWITTDESTVELSGTRAEADLIVAALRAYVAIEQVLRAHNVQLIEPVHHLSHDEQTAYARDLLASIAEPVYQDEAVAS